MKPTTYNGWSNYATWRVNRDMLNFDISKFWDMNRADIDEALPIELKAHVVDRLVDELGGDASSCFTFDYAMAFLEAVNWQQIAANRISNHFCGLWRVKK